MSREWWAATPIMSERGAVVVVVVVVVLGWNDLLFLQLVGFPFGRGARWWEFIVTLPPVYRNALFWKKTG